VPLLCVFTAETWTFSQCWIRRASSFSVSFKDLTFFLFF
jgi:hypothetical protein